MENSMAVEWAWSLETEIALPTQISQVWFLSEPARGIDVSIVLLDANGCEEHKNEDQEDWEVGELRQCSDQGSNQSLEA
jgi:hypothetical protein